ncbi:MAG: response regulator transcription factor [Coprobacillus sp.]|nr:response regulator transcription factor [Coprobacillus sp.]
MKILVVEDEPEILDLLETILVKNGYKVKRAVDGGEALDLFLDEKFDMVICDEMMPVLSGNDLVKEIRKEDQSIPIIMVTAKGSVYDKEISYGLGVDDYMVKPINYDELIMRIKAIARRSKIETSNIIKVGNVVLDNNSHSITNKKKKESITLTKTEFDILFKLLSYPEKIFSKWQLFNEFWGVSSDVDDDIVKVFISKIRKQIEPFPEIGIKTIMGVGYQGIRNDAQEG